jgi:hypothetical protein
MQPVLHEFCWKPLLLDLGRSDVGNEWNASHATSWALGGGEGGGSEGGGGEGGGGSGACPGGMGGSEGGGGLNVEYTLTSARLSTREAPGSKMVTTRAVAWHSTRNGPTVAAAVALAHFCSVRLSRLGPTHSSNAPSRSWQQPTRL